MPEGKRQYKIGVLRARTLIINTGNVELFPLINEMCRIHKIDPVQFIDDDGDDISDDEDPIIQIE